MIGDTVSITEKGADVLTKFGKAVTGISYSMNEDDDEEADDSDDEDRMLAKKIARDEEAASSGERGLDVLHKVHSLLAGHKKLRS